MNNSNIHLKAQNKCLIHIWPNFPITPHCIEQIFLSSQLQGLHMHVRGPRPECQCQVCSQMCQFSPKGNYVIWGETRSPCWLVQSTGWIFPSLAKTVAGGKFSHLRGYLSPVQFLTNSVTLGGKSHKWKISSTEGKFHHLRGTFRNRVISAFPGGELSLIGGNCNHQGGN